jgi:DNA (cytosine-5)-methyltransferase 1
VGERAYYNDNDQFAAAWLRELIARDLIAPGEVDSRSIVDVRPDDLRGFTQCHFFAGIGTWSYALRAAGWPDDRPIWTGSCPCQPFSNAGQRTGRADRRHLWPAWFDLIRERHPRIIIGEQVAGPVGLEWYDALHADLESAGYACAAVDLCAAGLGAPHIRQRLFWMADASGARLSPRQCEAVDGARRRDQGRAIEQRGGASAWQPADWLDCKDGRRRPVEPGTFPLAHGAASRVGRLRAYGNAIVAPQAEAFIRACM